MTTRHDVSRTHAKTEGAPGLKPVSALLMRLLWATAVMLPAFDPQSAAVFTSLCSFPKFFNGQSPYKRIIYEVTNHGSSAPATTRVEVDSNPPTQGFAKEMKTDWALTNAMGGRSDFKLKPAGTILRVFNLHGHGAVGLAFTPDGQSALSWSCDGIILSDIDTGKEIRSFGTPFVGNVALSPDGRYVLASHHLTGCDSFIQYPDNETTKLTLWDISSGREGRTIFTFHGIDPYLSFIADGRYVYSLSSVYRGGNHFDGSKWDTQDWKVTQKFRTANFFDSSSFAPSFDLINGSPALSHDGGYLLLAVSHPVDLYRYTHLILCETATGRQLMRSKIEKEEVSFLSFSPDGRSALVSAHSYIWTDEAGSQTSSSRLQLWDFKSDELSELFSTEGGYAGPVAFSPDGRYAIASFHSKIVVVEIASKLVVRQFDGSFAGCMQISPDGRYLLTAIGDYLYLPQKKIGNEMILWKLWEGDKTGL